MVYYIEKAISVVALWRRGCRRVKDTGGVPQQYIRNHVSARKRGFRPLCATRKHKDYWSLRQSMRILRGKLVMSFPGPSPKDYRRPADEGEVQDEE